MGSQWTHDEKKKTKCLSFRLHWRCESDWEYPNLVGHRKLCLKNERRQSIKEGTAGTEDAREYEEAQRRAVRSGRAVEWNSSKLTEQLQLSLGSALLTGEKIPEGPNVKSLYQQSIDTNVERVLVKILDKSEVKGTFGKQWYLPHHPVLNPNKPGKVRRVCNTASQYKEVCLKEKLLAGLDLMERYSDFVKDQDQ